jgi:hypothetical protein
VCVCVRVRVCACVRAENVTESCVCRVRKQVLNSGKILNDRFSIGQRKYQMCFNCKALRDIGR